MDRDGYDRATPVAEKMVSALIDMHGAETVKAHVAEILPGARWHDWQKLNNMVDRIARKKMKKSVA